MEEEYINDLLNQIKTLEQTNQNLSKELENKKKELKNVTDQIDFVENKKNK